MTRAALSILALSVMLLGCGDDVGTFREDGTTIAVVGRLAVTLTEFQSTFEGADPGDESGDLVRSRLLDRFVDDLLILNDAMDPENQAIRPLAEAFPPVNRQEEMSRKLHEKVYSRIQVTDQEIAAYYVKHEADFQRGKGYLIQEIQVPSRDAAQEVVDLLKSRKSFEEVARSHSLTPDGGARRYFEDAEIPEYLRPVLKRLSPGGFSYPIRASEETYQIIRLCRRTDSYTLPLESVAAQIRLQLGDQKAAKLREEYLQTLRRDSRILVFHEKLPFRYVKETP